MGARHLQWRERDSACFVRIIQSDGEEEEEVIKARWRCKTLFAGGSAAVCQLMAPSEVDVVVTKLMVTSFAKV